jgi:hypothetical protein
MTLKKTMRMPLCIFLLMAFVCSSSTSRAGFLHENTHEERKITVELEKIFTIDLPANPSTGYSSDTDRRRGVHSRAPEYSRFRRHK